MKFSPFVSSLRIKKLFGEQDLSVDFNALTVIVGKNGLGKTTLLKIINGLVSGKKYSDYDEICESVELGFSDGNYICYGVVNDGLIQSLTNKESVENFELSENGFNKLINSFTLFDEIKDISEKDKQKLLESLVKQFINSDDFKLQVSDSLMRKFEENKNRIFTNKVHRDWLKDNLIVRYISTVNISANAGTKMDLGNSIEKNLLDLAIHEEMRVLIGKKNATAISAFLKNLNEFFHESRKKARISHGECIFETSSGVRLNLGQLSSGERQLVYILATAANTCGKSALFLMDEPEVSLHLSWQEKVIDAIMSINPQMQIIAVTHSPGIMMNGHMDAYVEMISILKGAENV